MNVLNKAIFWLSQHQTIVAKKNCVLSSKEKSLYYIENTSRGLRFCERISLLSQNREELAKNFYFFQRSYIFWRQTYLSLQNILQSVFIRKLGVEKNFLSLIWSSIFISYFSSISNIAGLCAILDSKYFMVSALSLSLLKHGWTYYAEAITLILWR